MLTVLSVEDSSCEGVCSSEGVVSEEVSEPDCSLLLFCDSVCDGVEDDVLDDADCVAEDVAEDDEDSVSEEVVE